ncbi:MAG: DUF1501 domain-containing protein [Candidatus Puniceispirillales bacterium]
MINRRDFILGSVTLTMLGSPLFSARAEKLEKRNLVVILLRGGMDGLTAVPPNDPILASRRPDIMVENTLSLSADFGLNPKLQEFYKCWQDGKASVFHATNIPYTMRSHFEGQDLMESGGLTPFAESTGWLGRGIHAAHLDGLAISLPMPLLLRGPKNVDNYYPTHFDIPSPAMMEMVQQTYPPDSLLANTMEKVIARPVSMLQSNSSRDAHNLARTASRMLAKPDGPRIAVFDIEGFDTHASQGGGEGEHADKLADYDLILSRLKQGMGDAFDHTLIVTLTEFGRKLDQNGGSGTEHGFGTAVLLAGGLVKGGVVHTDWPGLQKKNLYEGQDLQATMDARSIYCSAMATCFQVDFDHLRRQVFWNAPLVDLTNKLFI